MTYVGEIIYSNKPIPWFSISKHNTPVVFKDRITEWPCSNWTIEDWGLHCDDIPFKFRSSPHNSASQWESDCAYTQATLNQFTSWLNEKPASLSDDNPLKIFNRDSEWCYSSYNYMTEVFQTRPELLRIVDWGIFGLEGRSGNESTLWAGSCGSNTPCHQDAYGSNLVAQLIGKKLWVMFPPEDSESLYPTRVPYEESSVFSSINILNPDFESFPLYTATKPYLVVLEPGDVLYIPPKWWHYVISLETSVSVNSWIEHSLDDLWRLEEAVVRFAMTAFISTYQKNHPTWINPTEDLGSSSETSKLLDLALERSDTCPLGLTNTNSTIDSDYLEPIEVEKLSFDNFEKEMCKLVSYKTCVVSHKKNELVDYINCFLKSNVITAIIDNLKKKNGK